MEDTNDSDQPEAWSEAGGRASIVEYFGIEGLFGYRSVSLASKFAATIVIAKNGSGKTTLLGALDAFLKCQFGRLSELQFSRIECRLRGFKDLLILQKSDLNQLRKFAENQEIVRMSKMHELDSTELVHFLLWDYPSLKTQSFRDQHEHPIFRKFFSQTPQTSQATHALLEGLRASAQINSPRLNQLQRNIRSALADIEIVYLPTYRRIELSLPEVDESRIGRRAPSIHTRLGLNRRGLHSGDIQFGLADISERLKQLNQDMLVESNQGYREVSANIINDLMDGAFEVESPSEAKRPSKEALTLFFDRLKAGRRMMGPYPYSADFKIPDLDRIYSGEDIKENSKRFLTYFLGKLNTVMQKTRDIEGVVEEFIVNCNRYLSGEDDSVEVPGKSLRLANDDKLLQLDRATLEVSVISVPAKRRVPLDALSSGEKQMISLFARLYLYPKEKIVLIDEPELSLSIDWQRKILLDIVNSRTCKQVIAITHSPFVFDNELDPFATPLKMKIDASVMPSAQGDEGIEHE